MRILLYPHGTLHHAWGITKLKRMINDHEVTNDPKSGFDVAIFWSYSTKTEIDETLKEISSKQKVYNIGGVNASKSRIEEVMLQTFGYNAIINPFKETEFCEKNELQGSHDVKIMHEIKEKKEGYIYCKLINNVINDIGIDYRAFVFGDEIALVRILKKSKESRFKGGLFGTKEMTTNPNDMFSKEEQFNILLFCRNLGIDFTELDILRDADGRIYIVDSNNVSGRLPDYIYGGYDKWFYGILKDSFNKMIK